MPCASGFSTTVRFQITSSGSAGGAEPGGDGISFSFHNAGLAVDAVECGPTNNSIGVSFNTFHNYGLEPSANFVGITSNRETWLLQRDLNLTGINLSDGREHSARITFDGASLSVMVDGIMMITNFPVAASHAMDADGNAWVGLGARTGWAWENHDILSWSFCSSTSVPPTGSWIAGPITNAANGHWYYLLSPTNWPAAEAIAVSRGGHLATINNAAENQWVFDNFSSFGVVERTLWLGLNDAGQEYIWFWASGQPVTYVNWAPGEPNNGGGYFPNEDHTLMWNPSSGYPAGSWNDSPEDQPHCAVVEVSPPEPVIVAGPITNPANGHHYFLLTYTNWPAAEQIAVSLGGHLATINDAAENEWIFNTFGSYGGLERPMWIGLNDAAQEGSWVWVNGEPATYRNWSPIEPNSGNGVFPDEDHVMMWHPSSGYPLGSWNDGPSNQLQYAVVEVLTAEQAAERLAQAVRDGVENSQPLLASLNAAIASMDRGNPTAAINQLQAFQNKVAAQVAPLNPELADLFIRLAQEVIDALNGGVPAGTPPVKIHKATRQADGKFKVHATGAAGRIHIVEASTDLVTWERIGVARRNAAGEFEFEDSRASQFNGRFYRIATP